jgi:hypothetical protein
MQYILTEQEFRDLTAARRKRDSLEQSELFALCRAVANNAPVSMYRELVGDEPQLLADLGEPWGCIKDTPHHYCDLCPAQKMCPSDDKEWSQ